MAWWRKRAEVVVLFLVLALAAPVAVSRAAAAGLDDVAIHTLVAELLAGGREDIRHGYTLAVSTPVSLHNLYATSSFGRLLGERLLGELQRAGVDIVDVRKTPALLISERLERLHAALADFEPREQHLLRARLDGVASFRELAAQLGYGSDSAARRAFYDAQARLALRLKDGE